jgi:hypothetical protein
VPGSRNLDRQNPPRVKVGLAQTDLVTNKEIYNLQIATQLFSFKRLIAKNGHENDLQIFPPCGNQLLRKAPPVKSERNLLKKHF